MTQHFAPARAGDRQCSAIHILGYPFTREGHSQERGSERAGDVRAPLAPVQTAKREPPAQRSRSGDVNAKSLQALRSLRGEIVGRLFGREPSERRDSIVEPDTQRAGDMVVASSRRAQSIRCVGQESPPRRQDCNSGACPEPACVPDARIATGSGERSRSKDSRQRLRQARCWCAHGGPSGNRGCAPAPARRSRRRFSKQRRQFLHPQFELRRSMRVRNPTHGGEPSLERRRAGRPCDVACVHKRLMLNGSPPGHIDRMPASPICLR